MNTVTKMDICTKTEHSERRLSLVMMLSSGGALPGIKGGLPDCYILAAKLKDYTTVPQLLQLTDVSVAITGNLWMFWRQHALKIFREP